MLTSSRLPVCRPVKRMPNLGEVQFLAAEIRMTVTGWATSQGFEDAMG